MSGRQWSIKLVGATAHLSLLASIFAEDPATIVLTDDEYYLGGSFLNHCVGAREAIRIGEARLRLMLGAARIETGYDAFQADLFGMVCCKEANGSTAIILVTGESTQESGNDALAWSHAPGLSRDYLAAAEGNAHLELALKLWADTDRTWPRLYRIVEEIYVSFRSRRDEYPSEVLFRSSLVDSREDYVRFANSANEARYAGSESRHAMGNNKMPKEVGKLEKKFLSHAEAVSFVRECLKRALGHRANLTG
jgi:hypothetical protein